MVNKNINKPNVKKHSRYIDEKEFNYFFDWGDILNALLTKYCFCLSTSKINIQILIPYNENNEKKYKYKHIQKFFLFRIYKYIYT